jgi:hypothetical protein
MAPLRVETDLDLRIDGYQAEVGSNGAEIFIDFGSLSAANNVQRSLHPDLLPKLFAVLTATDLTLELRSRGKTIMTIGSTATAGPISKVLGVAPAQIHVAGLIGSVTRAFAARLRGVVSN